MADETTTKPADETAVKATESPKEAAPAGQGIPGILPAEYWSALAETRAADDDADSSLGYDDESTASLSSSILHYRTIKGRRFHSEQGDAEYWAANDEAQNEALDIIHHVLLLVLEEKLYLAPLEKNIEKVIDIGTGTGLWAIDFAEEFPKATVIGTEISPIQPSWVPPNCEFQIDDCTQEWTWPENSIDYVHIRWLFGSIKDWTALFKQAYKCLKPGGYLESHEASVSFDSDDGTVNEKTAMGQFSKFFIEGAKQTGRSMTVVEDGVQRKSMEEAGFVDLQEENFKTPIGSWPKDPKKKEIGQYQQMAVEQDTEGVLLYMAGLVGWSQDEMRVYIAQLRREFRCKDIHGFYRQKIVWGRKPMKS